MTLLTLDRTARGSGGPTHSQPFWSCIFFQAWNFTSALVDWRPAKAHKALSPLSSFPFCQRAGLSVCLWRSLTPSYRHACPPTTHETPMSCSGALKMSRNDIFRGQTSRVRRRSWSEVTEGKVQIFFSALHGFEFIDILFGLTSMQSWMRYEWTKEWINKQ